MFNDIDIPIRVRIIGTISLGLLIGYTVYSFYARERQSSECFLTAKDWVEAVHMPQYRDPAQDPYFATKLAQYRLACPNGHAIVEENRIDPKLEALAKTATILNAARVAAERASR